MRIDASHAALSALAGVLLLPALVLAQGAIDPCKIALTDSDKSAIMAMLDEQSPRLGSDSPAEVRRARDAILALVDRDCTSVAFRFELSKGLIPVLRAGIADSRPHVSFNAIRLAGELATEPSLELLESARKDASPSVRFMAVMGMGSTLDSVRAGRAPAMSPASIGQILSRLEEGLRAETDPQVVDAYVQALALALPADPAVFSGVKSRAVRIMCDGLSERLRKLDSKGSDPFSGVALRAMSTLRDVMAFSPDGIREDPVAVKSVAGFAGHALASVHARLAAGEIPVVPANASQPERDDVLRRRAEWVQLASSAESVIALAREYVGVGKGTATIGAELDKASNVGDKSAQAAIELMLGPSGPLLQPPWSFAADTFKK